MYFISYCFFSQSLPDLVRAEHENFSIIILAIIFHLSIPYCGNWYECNSSRNIKFLLFLFYYVNSFIFSLTYHRVVTLDLMQSLGRILIYSDASFLTSISWSHGMAFLHNASAYHSFSWKSHCMYLTGNTFQGGIII